MEITNLEEAFERINELEIEIAELKKENAKLKNERNAFKIYSDGAELDAINLNEQLNEAKELLELVLDWQSRCGNGHPTWSEVVSRVEAFLKE